MTNQTRRFLLGQIAATPGAIQIIEEAGQTLLEFICRHAACDWGEVCNEDKQLNDNALLEGSRLLSAYKTGIGERIWVITEADRSVTTLLRPEEY